MKTFVGIDLGTTNSAIVAFDGETVRLYKSPEQNDVTPSAISVDKRGNRFFGSRAYDNRARSPDNVADGFKRFMGTSTPIKLPAVNITMTPEECSAEILKVLFGYLPEEIRNDEETGTVITVPAAFNQMQKDATMAAAEMAGIGRVALMQEPVAAVMSVMRQRRGDGIFVVYDLGGGTLDIAIAQSTSGRVSLLAHGGVAMCGGRDFDRSIVHNVAKPWLLKTFRLPEDFPGNPKYRVLLRTAEWAAEKAKIELSSKEGAIIVASESEVGTRDEAGNDIYLEIPLDRSTLDTLVSENVAKSIDTARETIEKAGLSARDIERVVFVGGPTQYKPLRDRVAFELGIAASTDVNPMTAVAEGAAVFAESIDWSSQSRGPKSTRGEISAAGRLDLAFSFIARTPDNRAKVVVKMGGAALPGAAFQIDSQDTGWSSGRAALKDGATIDLDLPKPGENTFKIHVFDAQGGPISLSNSKIVITRTEAMVDAIPASSSIGIEALDKLGGRPTLEYLVKEGEPLPKKGKLLFKAAESMRAGSASSLRFKIWEGPITDVVTDNRFIGVLNINGTDFDEGAIAQGAELVCEFEVLHSGNVFLEVSVPSIGAMVHRNFYSRQEGGIDYTNASKQVLEDAAIVRKRVEAVSSKVQSPKLDEALTKLDQASAIDPSETDPETSKRAMDNVLEAKRLLAQVRKQHLKLIRQLDLDQCIEFFDEHVREIARPTEASAFENLKRTAQRSIDNNGKDFESELDQLRGKAFQVLWRQDWFVVQRFKWLSTNAFLFPDRGQHAALSAAGEAAIKAADIDKLRQIVAELDSRRINAGGDDDMLLAANILRK